MLLKNFNAVSAFLLLPAAPASLSLSSLSLLKLGLTGTVPPKPNRLFIQVVASSSTSANSLTAGTAAFARLNPRLCKFLLELATARLASTKSSVRAPAASF